MMTVSDAVGVCIVVMVLLLIAGASSCYIGAIDECRRASDLVAAAGRQDLSTLIQRNNCEVSR